MGYRGIRSGELFRLYANDALVIASAAENDVRVCQMVQVEPNTVYRLSAEISAEGVHGGRGVCLSVDNYTLDGSYAVSAGRTGSFDWTRETLIVRTGAKQNYINFALRLGSYSETSAGTAPVPCSGACPNQRSGGDSVGGLAR